MQEDEELARIPITVTTGVTDATDPATDAGWRDRLGVADFVSKPFDAVQLAERIAAALGGPPSVD